MSNSILVNSTTLVNKIKDVIPPFNSAFLKLDVVSLFPHIPKSPTMKYMGELLVVANTPHEVILEFFTVSNLCWSSNFCKFNGCFYELPTEVGNPIGSLLESLIFEILMNKFEKDLFPSLSPSLLDRIIY